MSVWGNLQKSLAVREAHNMATGALVGTIWRPFLRRALEALMICAFLYLVDLTAAHFLPLPPCHFLALGRCSVLNETVLVRLVVLLPALFAASYISTSLCQRERFSHSASVSALVLIALLGALVFQHYSIWHLIAAVPAVTLTTFYAYRFTLH